MITDITIERVLEYLDSQMETLQDRLVKRYGDGILSNGGLPYYVDEEDSFLEYLSDEIPDFQNSNEEMIRLLKYWTNERTVYPREWVVWAWHKLIQEENKP